jgi:hypothetical protein
MISSDLNDQEGFWLSSRCLLLSLNGLAFGEPIHFIHRQSDECDVNGGAGLLFLFTRRLYARLSHPHSLINNQYWPAGRVQSTGKIAILFK